MIIDRLNSIDPTREFQKSQNAGRMAREGKGDSISISQDATHKAELYTALEAAKAAPDLRLDRLAEIKSKINDPSYMNDAVVSMTADRIIDQLVG